MSEEQKLTPWFEDIAPPTRKGVYQVRDIFGEEGYSYWDGKDWFHIMPKATTAYESAMVTGVRLSEGTVIEWRGLAEDPDRVPEDDHLEDWFAA